MAEVRLGLTVCVADKNCHPSQAAGRIKAQRGVPFFSRPTKRPETINNPSNEYPQEMGQAVSITSEKFCGTTILPSKMIGLPNFRKQSPTKTPVARQKRSGPQFSQGAGWVFSFGFAMGEWKVQKDLQPEFQQANLENQSFLSIGEQDSLSLLDDLQVFQRIATGDPVRDDVGVCL